MKFCPEHWASLKAAIDARGLGSLVADSGKEAGENMISELDHGVTIDNFDPLMAAHNQIWAGAMQSIKETYQQNPLMLMADDAEHPEWACPICALNWCHAEHNLLCTQERCNYPRDYDWAESIEMSADRTLAAWKELGGQTDETLQEVLGITPADAEKAHLQMERELRGQLEP